MTPASVDPALRALAADLLFREADALDNQDWANWLAMYREDARYWVPAWIDEHRTTADPDTELSLIYHTTRRGLEERVGRIQSRKSITATPLPRTLHLIAGLTVAEADTEAMRVRSNAAVHVYDARTAAHHVAALRYEHSFRCAPGGGWLIAAKTIVLVNDRMPSVVDFYAL